MKHPVTLKRVGEGYYHVLLHGEHLTRFAVWDRRMMRKRRRGWALVIQGGVFSGTREEIFPTLKLLREWVTREYGFVGDGVGAH